MQKLSISKATPGMVLAKPVVTSSGVTLVGADKELTEGLITALENKKIKKVYVKGNPLSTGPSKAPEELEAEITARFSNMEGDRVMMKLRDLFIARVHARSEESEEEEQGEDE